MDSAPNVPPAAPLESREHRYFNEPILSTSSTVRQHTVPRLYLTRFTVKNRVPVYDFLRDKAFSNSLKNVGVWTRFYDFETDSALLSAEAWLAEVESRAAPMLARLADDPDSIQQFSEEEEIVFARFIGAQRFRVPALEPFIGLLGEVQGWANLLVAMPWRTGLVYSTLPLYTCDNPVASYLTPVRPFWSGGALAEHTYIYPLSPQVLMWIDPLPYSKHSQPRGARTRKDFSEWETSFARHVITRSATRFVYGTKSPLSRECAISCLERIDWSKGRDAVHLQGFDPDNPRPLPE